MAIAGQKQQLRKNIKLALSALTEQQRQTKSELICRHARQYLSWLIEQENSQLGHFTLFTYMPTQSEVDVTAVMEWCWEQGYDIVVPKAIKELKQLRLHRINSYDDVEIGSWGIREPKPSTPILTNWSEISAMLVPGIAYDLIGGRMGYGGGYYDRWMQQLTDDHQAIGPLKLALAYEIQVVPEVPMESYDMRIDRIITETRP